MGSPWASVFSASEAQKFFFLKEVLILSLQLKEEWLLIFLEGA